MKKTITLLCLVGSWRASLLFSALRVQRNEKLKDRSDLNRPTSPYRSILTSETPKCSPECANTRKISVARQVVPDFHNTIAEVMFTNVGETV